MLDGLLQPDGVEKCTSVPESFSKPQVLSERFAQMSTWQWFQYAPSRDGVGRWILGTVCDGAGTDTGPVEPCERLDALTNASYVDVDFDAISHALTFTAVWSPFRTGMEPALEKAARTIRKTRRSDRVEVGTLKVEQSDEPEELSSGGFLTVLGEDDRPSKSLPISIRLMYAKRLRSDNVLIPFTTPSSPRLLALLIPCSLPATHRVTSEARNHTPTSQPQATKGLLRSARLLDSTVSPLHRSLPAV